MESLSMPCGPKQVTCVCVHVCVHAWGFDFLAGCFGFFLAGYY